MNVLEALYKTRESVEQGPYNYHIWDKCLCGHVFRAVEGRTPFCRDGYIEAIENSSSVQSVAVLEAIVRAHCPSLRRVSHPTAVVSMLAAVAHPQEDRGKARALYVLNYAILHEEGKRRFRRAKPQEARLHLVYEEVAA